jgi:hypothetical protein
METMQPHEQARDPRPMMEVVAVRPQEGHSLWLQFNDSTERIVDVGPILARGGPMVDPLTRDRALFEAVRVEDGTVVWPNGFDLDPDVLYYDDLRPEASTDASAVAPAAHAHR